MARPENRLPPPVVVAVTRFFPLAAVETVLPNPPPLRLPEAPRAIPEMRLP